MPLNDDSPFNFDERTIAPDGRIVRTVAVPPAPRRRKRRNGVDPEDPNMPLMELLKISIREVLEREIREAQSEGDLTRLLVRSIEDVEKRKKKAGNS